MSKFIDQIIRNSYLFHNKYWNFSIRCGSYLLIKNYSIPLSLLVFGMGVVAILLSSAIFLLKNSEVAGQIGAESEIKKNGKQDIFKVILTVNGLKQDSGDVITVVSVNGASKSKLFDDTKTYLNSINTGSISGEGIIEYISTFPEMAIKAGDEYKACALLIKDSNLICQTGKNSPALRPEIVDLHIQQEEATITSSTEALSIAQQNQEDEE
jgi:hypothetical protein